MLNYLYKHFLRGIELARNNPQIIYTLLLIIAIPYAFILSGQNFFLASSANQDRIEQESIYFLQDSFALIASDKLENSIALNDAVRYFKEKNSSITSFVVVKLENSTSTGIVTPLVIASLDEKEVGKELSDEFTKQFASQMEGALKSQTILTTVIVSEERHILAFRGIVDASGKMNAYFVTDISMKRLDDILSGNISKAYIYLIFIIAGIFVLLVRQARIIDYTILYKKLKEVDQMKDDFVSMAAHELRTPLTIIRGYVDLLGEIPNLDDKNKENLRRIDVSAKQLNLLVGDILDVSRLEQGRMSFNLAPLSIGDIIKELSESFQPVAKEKGLALSCEVPADLPLIFADPEKTKQIMTNFIGNAVKYTVTGSVTTKVSFDSVSKKVVVRISDTGVGISAEEQKRLFEKFYRIRNKETENVPGTGLGLWITHQMVLAMKGTISVESIKGKGTDFIVSFPSTSQKV